MENKKSKLPIICIGIIIVSLIAIVVLLLNLNNKENNEEQNLNVVNTENIEQENTDKKTFRDIAKKYVEESYDGKITDCKIEHVNLINTTEENGYTEVVESEPIIDKIVDKNEKVFIHVSFLIKPIDIEDQHVWAGNGELKDEEWIRHSWFAIVEDGEIISSGTGL